MGPFGPNKKGKNRYDPDDIVVILPAMKSPRPSPVEPSYAIIKKA